MTKYQPVKFKLEQYKYIKNTIKKDFGNVSIPKGLFIIIYLYKKYVPRTTKNRYKKMYGLNKKRSNIE